MRSADDYLALIPPLNANKPNFTATISVAVAPYADTQTFLAGLSQAFDLDVAIGVQLDATGQWIGQSRNVSIPVAQPWFAWGAANRGWGQGYWKGPTMIGNYIQSLDDDTYRRLLYAKVAANYGAGDIPSGQAALNKYFIDPETFVFLVDVAGAVTAVVPFSWDIANNGWGEAYWRVPGSFLNETQPTQQSIGMRWQLGVSGKIPTVVDLEILQQQLIPIAPAGVYLDMKVVTVNDTALFGWDLESEYVSGWGVGSWGASPDFVAQNIV